MIRIIALLVLIIGLGAGLYLVQHPQIFNPKAYFPDELGYGPLEKGIQLEKGFQIDVREPQRIPTTKIYNALKPKWVRFVYHPDKGIPSNIPSDVKILLVITSESATAPPIATNPPIDPSEQKKERTVGGYCDEKYAESFKAQNPDLNAWKAYVDQTYISTIEGLLKTNQRVDAIEVWNEQDLCVAKTGDFVPSDAYAYMLKKAADKITSYNRGIKVIMGGVGGGNYKYIEEMKEIDSWVFNQVDAIGVHPYGLSPDGWCYAKYEPPECGEHELPFNDLEVVINRYKEETGLPVWITEIGATDNENWLATYFDKMFNVFSRNDIPVAIWFPWTDEMLALDEVTDPAYNQYGLVDRYGTVKAIGVGFGEWGEKL